MVLLLAFLVLFVVLLLFVLLVMLAQVLRFINFCLFSAQRHDGIFKTLLRKLVAHLLQPSLLDLYFRKRIRNSLS